MKFLQTNQPRQEQESRSVGAFGPDLGPDLGPDGSNPSFEAVAGQTNPNCQLQNQTECVQVIREGLMMLTPMLILILVLVKQHQTRES